MKRGEGIDEYLTRNAHHGTSTRQPCRRRARVTQRRRPSGADPARVDQNHILNLRWASTGSLQHAAGASRSQAREPLRAASLAFRTDGCRWLSAIQTRLHFTGEGMTRSHGACTSGKVICTCLCATLLYTNDKQRRRSLRPGRRHCRWVSPAGSYGTAGCHPGIQMRTLEAQNSEALAVYALAVAHTSSA
jgi:hypothetical protein